MRRSVLIPAALAPLTVAAFAEAHEQWANGMPVPAWVKGSCCGAEDVHHLTSAQVHAMADGWHVEGYPDVLPYGTELPSQDGDYWIFYKRFPSGGVTPVHCWFVPEQSW